MITLSTVFSGSRVVQNLLEQKMNASLSYKVWMLANQMNEDLKVIEKLKSSFLSSEDSDAEINFIDFLNKEVSKIEYKKISFKDFEKANVEISPIELQFLIPFLEEL